MGRIDGLLVDIDGVLSVSWVAIAGAPEALVRVRDLGVPMRFATNTTTRSRAEVAGLLTSAGMTVEPDEILTAPVATAAHLRRHHPGARCFLLNSGDLSADMVGIDVVADGDDGPVDVVVVGGAGLNFTHRQLNRAFGHLLDGAAFVAMQPQPLLADRSGQGTGPRCLRGRPRGVVGPRPGGARQAGARLLRHRFG